MLGTFAYRNEDAAGQMVRNGERRDQERLESQHDRMPYSRSATDRAGGRDAGASEQ